MNIHKLAYAIKYASCALAASSILLTSSAIAQEDIEEVVVTSSLRPVPLSEAGMSISALNGESLKEMGAENFTDYLQTIPGINFTQGAAPGEQSIIIRGVDFPSNRFQQSTVAVFLDDISLSQNGRNPDLNLIDLERVEILRGPQGTLYGASSMGGAVRYITKKANTLGLEGQVNSGIEYTDEGGLGYKASGVINVPLNDTMAIRAVGYARSLDGWIDNVGWLNTYDYTPVTEQDATNAGFTGDYGETAEDNINTEETVGGRLNFLWELGTNTQLDIMHLFQTVEIGGLNNWNPNLSDDAGYDKYSISRRLKEDYKDDVQTTSLSLKHTANFADILWNSSYSDRSYRRIQDLSRKDQGLDWWAGDFSADFDYGIDAFTGGHAYRYRPIEWETTTHELRFTSNGDSDLAWIAGLYHSKADNRWEQYEVYPGAGDANAPFIPFDYQGDYDAAAVTDPLLYGTYGTDNWFTSARDEEVTQNSAYANITYKATDKLELTAGVRFFDVAIKNEIATSGVFSSAEAGILKAQLDDGDITNAEYEQGIFDLAQDNYESTQTRKSSEDGTQFMVGASYDVNDDLMAYVNIAQGYRIGGINRFIPSRDDVNVPEGFDSDSLISYELGWKADLGRVNFNGAVYHIIWEDLQVSENDPTTSFDYVVNAGEVNISGLEAEVKVNLFDNINVFSGLTYTDSELVESAGGLEKGDKLPGVADTNFYAGAQLNYTIKNLNGFVRADATYTGEKFYDEDFTAEDHTMVNLRAGLTNYQWEASVFVNNLTNDDTIIAQDNDRRSVGIAEELQDGRVVTQKPMTVGVNVGYYF
ncbi:MAG: TonB-dependent receptor [Oceanospirillaceae bacterium]|nr:TonB-dependent receptor [Oceanospirillaceae bacterium]